MSNILGKHEVKELQKTAILGTTTTNDDYDDDNNNTALSLPALNILMQKAEMLTACHKVSKFLAE